MCRYFLSQVIVCSATLHSFDVKKLSERIMHFPTWVDLKGEDSVPETVHHVVVPVNPKTDRLWERLGKNHIRVCRKEALALRFMSCQFHECKIIKRFLHLMFARLMRSMQKITPDLEPTLLVRQTKSRLDHLSRLSSHHTHQQMLCFGFCYQKGVYLF